MAIAEPPKTDFIERVRARLAQRGITGAKADSVLQKLDQRLSARVQQGADGSVPEDGSGFFGEAAKSIGRTTANIGAGVLSGAGPVAQYLGEAAAGAAALPLQVAEGAAGLMGNPALAAQYGGMAEQIASRGIDAARTLRSGIEQTRIGGVATPGQLAQVPRSIARSDTLAPSARAAGDLQQMADGKNFLPQTGAGWGSLTGEQVPTMGLAIGTTAALGPGAGLAITGIAAGAQEYEATIAQLQQQYPGRPMDFYEGEAARRFLQTAAIESVTERLPIGEILTGKLSRMFAGRAFKTWPRWAQVLGQQAAKGGTSALAEGGEEVVAEGAGAVGDYLSGDQQAFQGLGRRMATSGLIGAAMGGTLGVAIPGGMDAPPPATPPTRPDGFRGPTDGRGPTKPEEAGRSRKNPETPDNPTAAPDNRGQAPDPSPLDEAAALAEQRLNQQFNTPAPVGSPSPADQAASSQPEQGAVSDPTASVLLDLGINPADFAARVEQARVDQYRANPQQAYLDGNITRDQLVAFLEQRVANDPGEQLRRQAEARATGPQREMRRVDINPRPAVTINPNAQQQTAQQRRVPDRLDIVGRARKITEAIGKGWILDRRFGLMDTRQQEDMIRAGERLDPIWGETIKPEADQATLERLGIARVPQARPEPAKTPQGRAGTLADLLGMDSEADAQRYTNTLSPSERERLGLPQRAPEVQQQGQGSDSPTTTPAPKSTPPAKALQGTPELPAPSSSPSTEANRPVPSPQSTREPWQMTRGEYEGQSKVWNHQTWREFSAFDMKEARRLHPRRADSIDSLGFWFTDAKNTRMYGPVNVASRVEVKNPYSVKDTDNKAAWSILDEEMKRAGGPQAFREKLIRDGHDGVVLENTRTDMPKSSGESHNILIAFDPAQIEMIARDVDASAFEGQPTKPTPFSKHRAIVEAAHAAGKPVPPEVLAEYGLKPNPPAKPDSSTQPQGGSRLLGTRNRDTEEMRRARQRVENRKFRAFDRRRVKKENTARKNINHGFSGKAAPAPITRAEAEVATQEDMERLGQQVVESALGEPYGQIAHHPLVHKYVRVNVADYRPVDPTKDVYTEHETKVKQVEIWLAAEWRAREQRDALLRTLKSAGYKKVTVNANENGLVVQFVPTNDDVISQPQGQAAATTNKERTNGEEEAPQAQVLNEERSRLLDAIVKQENNTREAQGRFKIEEQAQLKGTDGNWYSANGFPQGVRSTGERRVRGYSVGSQSFQAREQAEKYVADRKAGDDIRADLADSSIEELRRILGDTGTAAPAQGTGAVSAEPFTRTDGTAKEAGTKRVEELRATFKTKRAGWHFAETDEGATLIHPTEDRVVRFKANQSNQTSRARTYAQAFADDNPVKAEQTAPGELKVQELKIGGEQPDDGVRVADKLAKTMTEQHAQNGYTTGVKGFGEKYAQLTDEQRRDLVKELVRRKLLPPVYAKMRKTSFTGFQIENHIANRLKELASDAKANREAFTESAGYKLAMGEQDASPAAPAPQPAPAKVEGKKPHTKPKPGDSAKSERQAEIDAIAPDSDLDATGTTTTIADIANNVREGKRRYVTARDSQNKRLGASMLESVRKSVASGMERLREERAKWENRGAADAATIPQEQTDGTGTGSAGGVGSTGADGQGARTRNPRTDARGSAKARGADRAPRPFSKADITRRLFKWLEQTGDNNREWLNDIASEQASGSQNEDFSTSFGDTKFRGEVEHWLEGRPYFRRFFKWNVENGTGEEAFKRLGYDRYFALVEETFTPNKVAKQRALELGGMNPEVDMLIWLDNRITNRPLEGKTASGKRRAIERAPYSAVNAEDLRDGQTLQIDGVNFEVMPTDDGLALVERTEDGGPAYQPEIWVLGGLTDVPVDNGTLASGSTDGERVVAGKMDPYIDEELDRLAGLGADPAPAKPPKFSDSEGVFGQKTETITGSQRGMFGDISPEPTPEMQERYPGIRRGETVAEYEKRIGITDTPEMFGGGTGGASPGIPFRSTPDINDRAAAKLLDWSSRARKRFDDYMGRQRRGEILGSGVDPTPYIDLAASVAFKALASGVTSKSGRKLTAFVEGRMADIRAKWPALNVTTATLRRQVRAMLAAANDDRDKIITAYAEARERAETARTKRAGKESGKPAEVREAVANATAERPDVAAKIIDAVRRGLRQGRAEGMRTASDALKPLIRQARDAAKRARQVAAIETRGAVDAAKAAAADRAATEKGIRDQAVRLVQETPIAGRRKYLKAVASAATMSDLARILHRLRGDLAKETGRHFALRAEKLGKNLRTLNADRRENARKLIDDVRKLYALLRDKDTGTARREEIAEQIRESFEALNTIFHEQKNQDKVSILGRAIQASDHREKMVESLEKRPEIPAPTNPNRKRDKGRIRVALDKFLTFQSLMQALDQEFYGNGMFARAGRAMAERRTAEFAKVQEFTDRADKIVRKYGYKGLGDFLAKSSGVLGEASQQWINVSLGEFKRITLGNALDIYARDAETREKMHKGQTFTFDAEGGTNSFTIDDNKLAEIENALTREQKQLAREVNRLRSDMQFDRMDEVYKLITGNYLVQVPEHYPIRRAMKLSESPDITKGLGEWTIKRMEEAGYLKQRVGGNAPIVIGDFGMTQLRQVQMAEAFINRASIVKYLGATMLHPDVRKAVVRHHGTKIMDRIQQTISEFSGNESPQQDRLMRRLLSNIARAQTQVNIGTWARNLATAFNIPLAVVDGKLLGVRKTLRGIAGALSSPAKTMRILMKHSPDLRHRWSHAGASISLMHGNDVQASTDIADTAFGDASKATVRQILTALKAIKAGDFKNQTAEIARPWRQLLDAIKLGNVFDGFGAMVAYHAVRADAPASLSPGAADKWAARRAADIFSQTANTNDLLNSNEWQMDARRSTWTAGLLAFTSDIAKKQNLLYLATKRGKKATAYATAAVTLGALWSVAVTAALSAGLGDDEDKIVNRAGEGLAKEFASLLPGGTVFSSGVETWINPRGTSGILDTPITAVAKNAVAAISKFKDAANDGDETDAADVAYRVLRILNDITGAPFGPTAGMVKRAVVNYGTE